LPVFKLSLNCFDTQANHTDEMAIGHDGILAKLITNGLFPHYVQIYIDGLPQREHVIKETNC